MFPVPGEILATVDGDLVVVTVKSELGLVKARMLPDEAASLLVELKDAIIAAKLGKTFALIDEMIDAGSDVVHINLGRGKGHTAYIKSRASKGDLVIFPNPYDIQARKEFNDADVVAVWQLWSIVGKSFDVVYVDNSTSLNDRECDLIKNTFKNQVRKLVFLG